MTDFLKFIFSDFWVFIGFLFIIDPVFKLLGQIITSLIQKSDIKSNTNANDVYIYIGGDWFVRDNFLFFQFEYIDDLRHDVIKVNYFEIKDYLVNGYLPNNKKTRSVLGLVPYVALAVNNIDPDKNSLIMFSSSNTGSKTSFVKEAHVFCRSEIKQFFKFFSSEHEYLFVRMDDLYDLCEQYIDLSGKKVHVVPNSSEVIALCSSTGIRK